MSNWTTDDNTTILLKRLVDNLKSIADLLA